MMSKSVQAKVNVIVSALDGKHGPEIQALVMVQVCRMLADHPSLILHNPGAPGLSRPLLPAFPW